MAMGKIKVTASSEPMRWTDEGEAESPLWRGPGDEGNAWDIRMSQEPDGVLAAKKIVDSIAERGVCICEANAPPALLEAAYDEALQLWEDGIFNPPFRVHDDRSMMEAQLWARTMKDDEKIVWMREQGPGAEALKGRNALKLLSKNIADFAGGLGELLDKKLNVKYDRMMNAMLTCYTGDRQYTLHIDNSHSEEEGPGLPDNGMRLSCTYYLNPHWDATQGCEGGMDIFLTDPMTAPASASAAKKARRIRIAPHADTLAIFLSERMAHQVIPTQGKEKKWFALTVWGLNGEAMNQVTRKLLALRQANSRAEADSDDD